MSSRNQSSRLASFVSCFWINAHHFVLGRIPSWRRGMWWCSGFLNLARQPFLSWLATLNISHPSLNCNHDLPPSPRFHPPPNLISTLRKWTGWTSGSAWTITSPRICLQLFIYLFFIHCTEDYWVISATCYWRCWEYGREWDKKESCFNKAFTMVGK